MQIQFDGQVTDITALLQDLRAKGHLVKSIKTTH